MKPPRHGFSNGGELPTSGKFRVFRWVAKHLLKSNTVLSRLKKMSQYFTPKREDFFAEHRFLQAKFDLVYEVTDIFTGMQDIGRSADLFFICFLPIFSLE